MAFLTRQKSKRVNDGARPNSEFPLIRERDKVFTPKKLHLRAGIYLTFEEVRGRKSTVREFRALLANFHREAVVEHVSILNNLLFGAGPTSKELHDLAVRHFMPPEIVERALRNRPPSEPLLFIYNQQQLLFLVKEALFACSAQGRLPRPKDIDFGLLFLMANDQLVPTLPPPSTRNEELLSQIAQFVPIFELAGSHRWQPALLRPYLLLTRWRAMHKAGKTPFEPDEMFHKATGISIDLYFGFTFALIAKSLEFNLEQFAKNPQAFGVDRAFFQNTSVESSTTDLYLNDISLPTSEFARMSDNKWINDFTCFKRTPAVRLDGRIYPIDFSLLAGKCDSALFWKINDSLLDNRVRERFHEFWGVLFEDYLNWFLNQTLDFKAHRFYADPRYINRPNEQVCDAIIVCGDDAVFLEYKANVFKVESKYSGDWRILEEDIERKLVGVDANKKGIRQLSEAVERTVSLGEVVRGVDLSHVRKIFPTLITLDGLGGAALLNTYLARRFKQLHRHRPSRVIVTPPFCLSAEQLEMSSGHLLQMSLTRLLEERYKADRELRYPFGLVVGAAKSSNGNLPPPFTYALDSMASMIKLKFFNV